MITRPTLNGLVPRTARDLRRDPFDWIDGAPASKVLGARGSMRIDGPRGFDVTRAGHRFVAALSLVGLCAMVAALLAGVL